MKRFFLTVVFMCMIGFTVSIPISCIPTMMVRKADFKTVTMWSVDRTKHFNFIIPVAMPDFTQEPYVCEMFWPIFQDYKHTAGCLVFRNKNDNTDAFVLGVHIMKDGKVIVWNLFDGDQYYVYDGEGSFPKAVSKEGFTQHYYKRFVPSATPPPEEKGV